MVTQIQILIKENPGEPRSQDAGGSEAAEDPEQQQACVGTLEQWLSLLESLDTRGRLMKAVKLDSGVVEAGCLPKN